MLYRWKLNILIRQIFKGTYLRGHLVQQYFMLTLTPLGAWRVGNKTTWTAAWLLIGHLVRLMNAYAPRFCQSCLYFPLSVLHIRLSCSLIHL